MKKNYINFNILYRCIKSISFLSNLINFFFHVYKKIKLGVANKIISLSESVL